MLLVNKKRIIYDGSEYYISIKKVINITDIPFTWIFGLDKYYRIKVYVINEIDLYNIISYKRILKLKVNVEKFNKDIDKVINYSLDRLKEHCKETKYINNTKEVYLADEEYKEKLYQEFYNRVIDDLKEKGLIPKELFNDNNRKPRYPNPTHW